MTLDEVWSEAWREGFGEGFAEGFAEGEATTEAAASESGAPHLDASVLSLRADCTPSVETIAWALHAIMLDAAATWPNPIRPGTCDEDGHLEEAADIRSRLVSP